jgi:hypothetical protein
MILGRAAVGLMQPSGSGFMKQFGGPNSFTIPSDGHVSRWLGKKNIEEDNAGIFNSSILLFAKRGAELRGSPCTYDDPLKAAMAWDGTDIRKIVKPTGKPDYRITGGEEFGQNENSLATFSSGEGGDDGETRRQITRELEKEYATHARPLGAAMDAQADSYPAEARARLCQFLIEKREALAKADVERTEYADKMRAKYRSGNTRKDITADLIGSQHTYLTNALRDCDAAAVALRSADASISKLSAVGSILDKVGLFELMDSLELVVVEVTIAATHYLLIMLQTLDHNLTVPIARIYYKNMDNATMFRMVTKVEKRVEEVTGGRCVVAVECFDGEHGGRRAGVGGGTGQGDAAAAVAFANDLALEAAGGGSANAHLTKAKQIADLAKWAQDNTTTDLTAALAGQQDSGIFMTPHLNKPKTREEIHSWRPPPRATAEGSLYPLGTKVTRIARSGKQQYGEVMSSELRSHKVWYFIDFHGSGCEWLPEAKAQEIKIDDDTYTTERELLLQPTRIMRFAAGPLGMEVSGDDKKLNPVSKVPLGGAADCLGVQIGDSILGVQGGAAGDTPTTIESHSELMSVLPSLARPMSIVFKIVDRAAAPFEFSRMNIFGHLKFLFAGKFRNGEADDSVLGLVSTFLPRQQCFDFASTCKYLRRQYLQVNLRVRRGGHSKLVHSVQLAGPNRGTVLDEALRGKVQELVEAIPVPLVKKDRLIPPTVDSDQWPLHLYFDKPGGNMLSVQAKSELATLHRLERRANDFIRSYDITARAKTLSVHRLTTNLGVGVLNKLAVEVFGRDLLQSEMASVHDKQPAISRILVFLRQKQACGSIKDEHKIYLELEESSKIPSSYKPEITVAKLKTHVANIKLRQLREEAHRQGRFYLPPKGHAVACVDPYHNFHNFVTQLLKQLCGHGVDDADDNDDGGGGDSGERVLVLAHLQAAAELLGDRDLISILSGSFDRHSHLCTSLVIDNPALWAKMKELGYVREAKVLEIMGGAYAAWCKPHSTEGDRTRSLHLLTVMVHRLFGAGLVDVRVLTCHSFGGFPCRQWLDFIANADARAALLDSLNEEERKLFKETSMTTISVESSFSLLPSSLGSSAKPPATQIQGKAPKLDAVRDIKRDPGTCTFQWSKRKRKAGDLFGGGSWNDGIDDNGAADRDRRKRLVTFVTGRMNVRLLNQKRGGMR